MLEIVGVVVSLFSLLGTILTGAKVFFGLDKRLAVLEALHASDLKALQSTIETGFDCIQRELDQIRQDFRQDRK
jgi:hypothetical protein